MIYWPAETFFIWNDAKSFIRDSGFFVNRIACPPQYALALKNLASKVWVAELPPDIPVSHVSARFLQWSTKVFLPFLLTQTDSVVSHSFDGSLRTCSFNRIEWIEFGAEAFQAVAPHIFASFLAQQMSVVLPFFEVIHFSAGLQLMGPANLLWTQVGGYFVEFLKGLVGSCQEKQISMVPKKFD